MPKRTRPYRDSLLEDLQEPLEAIAYLNAALADSDEMFLIALRDVAEAKQMARVAEAAGVARESIYRMLTQKGNPTYSSLVGILAALGLRLSITQAGSQASSSTSPTTACQCESEEMEAGESRPQDMQAGEWGWRKNKGSAGTNIPFPSPQNFSAGQLDAA
jgi:probable addiction module antidote protein